MRVRWVVAAVAALALAWVVLTIEMPWLAEQEESRIAAGEGGACAADAKPAALDFTLPGVDNEPVRLEDFKGKVILLDFWATWCGPCKIEIPWFLEFQEKYGPQGLQVVGVSVDDTLDKLRPYVESMKMTYVVLQGLGREDFIDRYGPLFALPTTILISRDGLICVKHTGLVSKDTLEQQIKELL